MTINTMYPSQIGIRASLPLQSWPFAVGLMDRALMFQYTPRKTQHARIRIPVSIACILSPQIIAKLFFVQKILLRLISVDEECASRKLIGVCIRWSLAGWRMEIGQRSI
jgi:hypothetical protein